MPPPSDRRAAAELLHDMCTSPTFVTRLTDPDISAFPHWLAVIMVVKFDSLDGPKVDTCYPRNVLSEAETQRLLRGCFPDTAAMQAGPSGGWMVIRFRRDNTLPFMRSALTEHKFLLGVACYRSVPDSTDGNRGVRQDSVVILSPLPASMLAPVLLPLATYISAHLRVFGEAAVHHACTGIAMWPKPDALCAERGPQQVELALPASAVVLRISNRSGMLRMPREMRQQTGMDDEQLSVEVQVLPTTAVQERLKSLRSILSSESSKRPGQGTDYGNFSSSPTLRQVLTRAADPLQESRLSQESGGGGFSSGDEALLLDGGARWQPTAVGSLWPLVDAPEEPDPLLQRPSSDGSSLSQVSAELDSILSSISSLLEGTEGEANEANEGAESPSPSPTKGSQRLGHGMRSLIKGSLVRKIKKKTDGRKRPPETTEQIVKSIVVSVLPFAELLQPFLRSLVYLWEVLITGSPLVLLSNNATRSSAAVLAILRLIQPLAYVDFRPYANPYDEDIEEYRRLFEKKEFRPVVIGGSDPLFISNFSKCPNMGVVGCSRSHFSCPAGSSSSNGLVVNVKNSQSLSWLRVKAAWRPAVVRKPPALRRVLDAAASPSAYSRALSAFVSSSRPRTSSGSSTPAAGATTSPADSLAIEKDFRNLTLQFLQPFKRFTEWNSKILMLKPLAEISAPPAFTPSNFIAGLEDKLNAGALLCGPFVSAPRGHVVEIYKKFVRTPHFHAWIAAELERGRRAAVLEQLQYCAAAEPRKLLPTISFQEGIDGCALLRNLLAEAPDVDLRTRQRVRALQRALSKAVGSLIGVDSVARQEVSAEVQKQPTVETVTSRSCEKGGRSTTPLISEGSNESYVSVAGASADSG